MILARTQLTHDDKILRHLPICPALLRLVRHVTCPLPLLTAKPSAAFNRISSINNISLTKLGEIKMPHGIQSHNYLSRFKHHSLESSSTSALARGSCDTSAPMELE
jgi:hypothetical protein